MSTNVQAPDMTAAAEKQGVSSTANTQQQTYANRPNQTYQGADGTVYGSSTWQSQNTGKFDAQGNPIESWNQTTQLGQQATDALNAQNQLQTNRSQLANGMFDRISAENANAPDWSSYQQMGDAVRPQNLQTSLDYSGAPQAGQNPNFQTVGQGPQGQTMGQGPQFQTGINGGQDYYNRAGDAAYGQATSRLDPQWQQSEDKMRAQLANQGLAAGDSSYDQQMQNFQRGKNDAYGSASNQATMLAGQEAQRMQGMDVQSGQFGNTWNQQGYQNQMGATGFNNALGQQGFQNQLAGSQFNNAAGQQGFQNQNVLRQQGVNELNQQGAFGNQAMGQQYGQDMSSSQYQNQLRQQQIAEQMQKQGWSLNQANALLSGQQVGMPSMPSFSNATKADATNYLGAAQAQGQADVAAAQQNGSMFGDIMGAVGGLGSAAAMFSDERLKKNVHRLPFSVAPGVPLAEYEMKAGGGKQLGVIAQDVEKKMPFAVSRDQRTGMKKVDYSQVAPGLPFSLGGRK
jgi:hypothetical protein